MGRFICSLLFCAVWFSKVAVADEVFWTELGPLYTYQDADRSCSYKSTPEIGSFFFMAQVNDSQQVVRAEFRNTNFPMYTSRIVFTQKEMAQIKVQRDSLGDYWLKSLPISSRLLGQLMRLVAATTNISLFSTRNYCGPTKQIANFKQGGSVFAFEAKDANSYFSPIQVFEGTMTDKNEFVVKLGLIQNNFMRP